MQLAERRFAGSQVVSISEGAASAALELHPGYFTYYWRSRLDPFGFIELIDQMQGIQKVAATSLTIIDVEGVKDFPAGETHSDTQEVIGSPSLVRFEGPGQSWVWQYAPDRIEEHQFHKFSKAQYRPGQAIYTGCASSGNHETIFMAANNLLASSAIEGENLLPYIDIFYRYLSLWRERKES